MDSSNWKTNLAKVDTTRELKFNIESSSRGVHSQVEAELPVSIEREALYELVWSEPMTQLATRFGVSDVALSKICKKMLIPVPGRGFWAKEKAGQTQSPKPLPKIKKGVPKVHLFKRRPADEIVKSRQFRRTNIEIKVSDRLVRPHYLVANTHKELKGQTPDESNLLSVAKGCLDVTVTRTQVGRSLRILDALLKSVEKLGYTVSVRAEHPYRTYGSIDTTEVEFRLKERLNRVKREPSSKDRGYSFERVSDFVANGKLALEILDFEYLGLGIQLTWSDGKKQRLEDCLGHFIEGLRVAAEARIAYNKAQEQRRREWEEARRLQFEEELRRQEEQKRVDDLLRQVDHWTRSQQIRAFVAAVRSEAGQKDRDDLEQWLKWAEGVADKMDPLINKT